MKVNTRKWNRGLGTAGLLLVAAICALVLSWRTPKPAVLEADPELSAAQRAFIASEGQARTAEKELEEVENDVPGWMSQLPPSVLKDTVNQLTKSLSPAKETGSTPAAGPTAPAVHPHTAGRLRTTAAHNTPASPSAPSSAVPGLKTEIRKDSKLQSLDSELAQIMAKARALKSAAKLAKVKAAAAEHASASDQIGGGEKQKPSSGATNKGNKGKGNKQPGSSLNDAEKAELGELFALNTVLHSIKSARKETLRLEHPNDPNYKPPPPPPSPAQQRREQEEAAKAKAARLKRLKDEDMARAEGKAALQQAARVLLRQLHGNKDKWLRKTLSTIASNAAQVEADKNGIKQLRSSLGSGSGGGDKRGLGGVAKAALRAAAKTKTERRVSQTVAATEAREKGEANRLLDHMLRMAHSDFRHSRGEVPKLQAEAKDGQIIHSAGKEAARAAIAREQRARRGEAKEREAEAKAQAAAGRAAEWGRHGGLSKEQAQLPSGKAPQSTLGLLAHDMVSDLKSLF